jgi:hypothetical protein
MSNYSEKRILVIGSRGHSLADKCVSWSEIKSPYLRYPYLGDYHLLIINLRSLFEAELDEKMGKELEKMREIINEIIWANTKIICITAPTIIKEGYIVHRDGEHFPAISNYHWCPIYLNFQAQEGEGFEEKPKIEYFDFINRWTHFLKDWSMKPYQLQKRNDVEPIFDDLLMNLAKKRLSFSVRFCEIYRI